MTDVSFAILYNSNKIELVFYDVHVKENADMYSKSSPNSKNRLFMQGLGEIPFSHELKIFKLSI